MKKCVYGGVIALLVGVSAGTKSSPSRPTEIGAPEESSSSITDAKTGVSLTTAIPVAPAANATIRFGDQPITLTVRNAVSSGGARTYAFQVATDPGFASVVFSKDGVAEAPAQTSLVIDKLAGSKTYFWRSHATVNGVSGLFSTVRSFAIGPEVVLQAPAAVAPSNGGTLSGQGLLVVANVARSGPAGALTYTFEVSDSESFANIVFAATVDEQGGQTAARVTANLSTNATYYWRARAVDRGNGVEGPYSAVATFRFVPFDMSQAVIHNSPADLGSWPETARITSVFLNPLGIEVDFDRREGPGRWPDEPFGSGSIEYTLGMCLDIGGTWHCSAVVQFWHGRELTAGGRPDEVGINWFYDPARWGVMTHRQPSTGEVVGLFVGAGNLRGRNEPGYVKCPRVCERSNVVLVPWSEDGSGRFAFSGLVQTLGVRR